MPPGYILFLKVMGMIKPTSDLSISFNSCSQVNQFALNFLLLFHYPSCIIHRSAMGNISYSGFTSLNRKQKICISVHCYLVFPKCPEITAHGRLGFIP